MSFPFHLLLTQVTVPGAAYTDHSSRAEEGWTEETKKQVSKYALVVGAGTGRPGRGLKLWGVYGASLKPDPIWPSKSSLKQRTALGTAESVCQSLSSLLDALHQGAGQGKGSESTCKLDHGSSLPSFTLQIGQPSTCSSQKCVQIFHPLISPPPKSLPLWLCIFFILKGKEMHVCG